MRSAKVVLRSSQASWGLAKAVLGPCKASVWHGNGLLWAGEHRLWGKWDGVEREIVERVSRADAWSIISIDVLISRQCLIIFMTTAIRLTCASVFCQSAPAASVGSHTIPVQKTPELSKYYGITFKFSSDKWKCFHQKVDLSRLYYELSCWSTIFLGSPSWPGVLWDLGCKVWLQHLETHGHARHHCLNAGKGRLRSQSTTRGHDSIHDDMNMSAMITWSRGVHSHDPKYHTMNNSSS